MTVRRTLSTAALRARALLAGLALAGTFVWAPGAARAAPERLTEDAILRILSAPAAIRSQDGVLHFSGFLTDANVDALIQAADAAPTHTLRIHSGGGDVSASLRAAEHIVAKRLKVEVDVLCASSCANYVFVAGVERRILPGAVVAWHGGADQKDFRERRQCGRTVSSFSGRPMTSTPQAVAASWDRSRREADFFRSVGVSGYITRAGQEPVFVGRDVTHTVEDMRAFGLDGVIAEPGYGSEAFCRRAAVERPGLALVCLPVTPRMLAYERARLAVGEVCTADGTLELRARSSGTRDSSASGSRPLDVRGVGSRAGARQTAEASARP